MDAADPSRETSTLHVSTLLVASERALVNALDELGFAENDDRVIEHEGRSPSSPAATMPIATISSR